MSGNFKVRCTHGVLPGTYFTTGKTYEVVDGKIVLDNGENSGHEINCLEDLDKHFASQFELLRNHSGEYISIKRCKKDKRVVAVMSVDGEYKKSANVKLKDFDGDFAKAAKAAVDKLVLIDSKRPETTVKVAPLYRIVKQDKYEMGDKVKIIDKSTGCTCDRLTKHYGNILTVKAFSGWNYDFEETSDKLPGKDIQGKVIEDNVKEETPLTADGFKVGDKVRLRKGLNVGQRYGTTTLMPFMVFDGTKIVKSVHEDDGDCILEFIYSKEMLELAENQTYSTPFDWTSFKSGKFAIHCDTEEKAKAFLKECDEHGIKWGNSKKPSDDFSWQSSYPCYHCNGSLFHDDINYCKNDIKIDIIPYATSTPTVKEVSRKAKVGEYIKLTASKAGGNAGDICKVDHLTKANDCGVYVILPTGETSLCICNKYYVVLEGYTPDVKPEVKEVKRHANPNDFIKIVRASGTNRKYKDGDILKVKYCHSTTAVTVYDFEFPGICDTEYVVLEDYVPEDKPTVIEVERPAKVGEWVKILRVDSFTEEDHKVGDIFQAIECTSGRYTNSAYYANRKDGCGYVNFGDYVVLENYTPEITPIDSKPEPEQPTSSTSMREVERAAKPGEYVKVVKAFNIPETDGKLEYMNGDILKVTNSHMGQAAYAEGKADNGRYRVLIDSEYVVLENFDYSVFPKNEPWRKAKVGDKIKVVRDNGHHSPKPIIGDIHVVTKMCNDPLGVWTDKNNVFWDTEQEYIIIEEAKETVADKPVISKEAIGIGDTVKIIGSGNTCSEYYEFVKTNAENFQGKFQRGYSPKNGDIGVVVGKGDRNGFGDLAFVVLANDKAFCICKAGIEKVRA